MWDMDQGSGPGFRWNKLPNSPLLMGQVAEDLSLQPCHSLIYKCDGTATPQKHIFTSAFKCTSGAQHTLGPKCSSREGPSFLLLCFPLLI